MEIRNFAVTDDLLASKGQRFLNCIIDQIIVYALVLGVVFLIGIVTVLMENYAVVEWMQTVNRLESYLLFGSGVILYYNAMEMPLGRSIGKFITGTIVVMEDGSKADKGTIMRRTFCRLIPFEHFSFLGTRGWHDSISDTYVVKKAAFEEARDLFNSFEEIGRKEEM